ncbi:MAG TPA: hypothetical protein VJA23_01415 [Candidatus Nanoarchaeia archaeon]|nr:hypothetical protein [Candidatus Nanoarchaeia archaeon]
MEPSIRAMIGPKYDEGIVHEVGAILDKIYTDKQPKNYLGRDLFSDYLNRAFFLPEPAKRTSHSADLSDRLDLQESDSAAILKHLSSISEYYQNEGPAGYSSGNPNAGYSSNSRCYQ